MGLIRLRSVLEILEQGCYSGRRRLYSLLYVSAQDLLLPTSGRHDFANGMRSRAVQLLLPWVFLAALEIIWSLFVVVSMDETKLLTAEP